MQIIAVLVLMVSTAHAGWLHHCMHDARQVCIQAHAALDEPTTTTTTLPCHFDVLPYEGGNTQPDYCEQTPSYCVTITGCGYTAAVPYCIPSEVMDHCAYPGTCGRLY